MSYYWRLITHFVKIATPLHARTKKDVRFEWTKESQEVSEALKAVITRSPVLAYPNFG